jgi:hypothetical protein
VASEKEKAMALEKELQTFEKNRATLLGTAMGKFALIKGDQIIDVFASEEDALKRGYEAYGNTAFLVKRVLEVEVPMNFTSFAFTI